MKTSKAKGLLTDIENAILLLNVNKRLSDLDKRDRNCSAIANLLDYVKSELSNEFQVKTTLDRVDKELPQKA